MSPLPTPWPSSQLRRVVFPCNPIHHLLQHRRRLRAGHQVALFEYDRGHTTQAIRGGLLDVGFDLGIILWIVERYELKRPCGCEDDQRKSRERDAESGNLKPVARSGRWLLGHTHLFLPCIGPPFSSRRTRSRHLEFSTWGRTKVRQ